MPNTVDPLRRHFLKWGVSSLSLLCLPASLWAKTAKKEETEETDTLPEKKKRLKNDEAPAKKPAPFVVMIDPGHGGADPGAIGKTGAREKDIVLSIAKMLKKLVNAEKGMKAVLTRDRDQFVSLEDRVQKARKIRADIFISIHADAFIKPNVRGASVFALSERGATSSAAKWLAEKQNEVDLIGGVRINTQDRYLAHTLFDLTQTATIHDSLKLGKAVLSELGQINALHRGLVEQAGFAVLKAPDIPSILVETAFISNPEEEKRLKEVGHQKKIAKAILEGIQRYAQKHPAFDQKNKKKRNLT